MDEKHQRALTRYYIAAGAAGVAVGVHTTQFRIREKGMLEDVLSITAQSVQEHEVRRPIIKVAGVCGPTEQAVREAELASGLGYHLALVSPVGVEAWSEARLLERTRMIAEIMPVFGFYLQPAVGGRRLGYGFWRALADIPGVMAIKVAPFGRYETMEVVRAVANSERGEDIALYTGNDDCIVPDMLSEFRFMVGGRAVRRRFVGGLLGQFAVWTRFSVTLLETIKRFWKTRGQVTELRDLMALSSELTDANSAIFDSSNGFKGSIVGIQEVLRRQRLVRNRFTVDPGERLSESQSREIDRVLKEHPRLTRTDDSFIKAHLTEWLG